MTGVAEANFQKKIDLRAASYSPGLTTALRVAGKVVAFLAAGTFFAVLITHNFVPLSKGIRYGVMLGAPIGLAVIASLLIGKSKERAKLQLAREELGAEMHERGEHEVFKSTEHLQKIADVHGLEVPKASAAQFRAGLNIPIEDPQEREIQRALAKNRSLLKEKSFGEYRANLERITRQRPRGLFADVKAPDSQGVYLVATAHEYLFSLVSFCESPAAKKFKSYGLAQYYIHKFEAIEMRWLLQGACEDAELQKDESCVLAQSYIRKWQKLEVEGRNQEAVEQWVAEVCDQLSPYLEAFISKNPENEKHKGSRDKEIAQWMAQVRAQLPEYLMSTVSNKLERLSLARKELIEACGNREQPKEVKEALDSSQKLLDETKIVDSEETYLKVEKALCGVLQLKQMMKMAVSTDWKSRVAAAKRELKLCEKNAKNNLLHRFLLRAEKIESKQAQLLQYGLAVKALYPDVYEKLKGRDPHRFHFYLKEMEKEEGEGLSAISFSDLESFVGDWAKYDLSNYAKIVGHKEFAQYHSLKQPLELLNAQLDAIDVLFQTNPKDALAKLAQFEKRELHETKLYINFRGRMTHRSRFVYGLALSLKEKKDQKEALRPLSDDPPSVVTLKRRQLAQQKQVDATSSSYARTVIVLEALSLLGAAAAAIAGYFLKGRIASTVCYSVGLGSSFVGLYLIQEHGSYAVKKKKWVDMTQKMTEKGARSVKGKEAKAVKRTLDGLGIDGERAVAHTMAYKRGPTVSRMDRMRGKFKKKEEVVGAKPAAVASKIVDQLMVKRRYYAQLCEQQACSGAVDLEKLEEAKREAQKEEADRPVFKLYEKAKAEGRFDASILKQLAIYVENR